MALQERTKAAPRRVHFGSDLYAVDPAQHIEEIAGPGAVRATLKKHLG